MEGYEAMDLTTISVGAVLCLYGLFTWITRVKNPEGFAKLNAMKVKFGKTTGTAIHVLAYSVLPIILGIMLVLAGFKGVSLLDMIAA